MRHGARSPLFHKNGLVGRFIPVTMLDAEGDTGLWRGFASESAVGDDEVRFGDDTALKNEPKEMSR